MSDFEVDNVNAIADLARQGVMPKPHPDKEGTPFVVLLDSDGSQKVVPLPPEQRPMRHKGTIQMFDVSSFAMLVSELKTPATRIYGVSTPARFVAVINDHLQDAAAWRDFRVNFSVPHSIEWTTWTKSNRQRMGQESFALFLEDNLPDVNFPTGAELLEIILDFEASKTGTFRSAARLQDGSINFVWADQNAGRDGGQVKLPPVFKLAIPVFENSEPVELNARLKYRLSECNLQLWYELERPHKVLEAAFRDLWEEIEQLDCPVLRGTPE
jgi:uncharacterized protein YfdQ (DUF2303 family)